MCFQHYAVWLRNLGDNEEHRGEDSGLRKKMLQEDHANRVDAKGEQLRTVPKDTSQTESNAEDNSEEDGTIRPYMQDEQRQENKDAGVWNDGQQQQERTSP